MQATWRNVRDTGGYAFRADVEQTIVPVASLTNVGQTSHRSQYHIEGKANPAAGQLELSLWDGAAACSAPAAPRS